MKIVLSIALIAISFITFGQTDKLSFYFSPDADYRTYNSKIGSMGEAWGRHQSFKPGYTIGADYEWKVGKQLSVFTGFYFTNKGYQIKRGSLRFSDQILPKKGFIFPTSDNPVFDVRLRYNYHFIGQRVGVNYLIPLKKFKILLGGGLGVNYLINPKSQVTYYYADGSKENRYRSDSRPAYKDFSFSAFVHAGVEMGLKNGYGLRVLPNFNYIFTNIMDTKIIYKVYPYSIGLSFVAYKEF